MAENETYLTKTDPSVEDWLAFNNDLFTALKGQEPEKNLEYAPFVDVDRHALTAGISTEEYFNKISERVGLLGNAVLKLVHSEIDEAWHIIIASKEAVQDLEAEPRLHL